MCKDEILIFGRKVPRQRFTNCFLMEEALRRISVIDNLQEAKSAYRQAEVVRKAALRRFGKLYEIIYINEQPANSGDCNLTKKEKTMTQEQDQQDTNPQENKPDSQTHVGGDKTEKAREGDKSEPRSEEKEEGQAQEGNAAA